jgi:hypothetical protein
VTPATITFRAAAVPALATIKSLSSKTWLHLKVRVEFPAIVIADRTSFVPEAEPPAGTKFTVTVAEEAVVLLTSISLITETTEVEV